MAKFNVSYFHDGSLFEDSNDWPLHDDDNDGSTIPVVGVEPENGSVSLLRAYF